MRIRRSLPILIVVLVVIAAIALLVTLRKQAPPEAARLLPGANGFVYVNVKWIRTFAGSVQLPPVSHDPEYQQFVEQTGFQFERDLDQVALAVHYPAKWGDGTAGSASEPRFSEIFVGKFDSARILAYLKKLSSSIDNYRGFDIYNIPHQGRLVRVTFLSYDSVAVSNHPDPEVIRGMIDRSRKLASPFGGPSLLRRFYREVPIASLAFAILEVKPSAMNALNDFTSWSLLFPKPAVIVFSARYLRALHLQAQAITGGEPDAEALADKVTTFLTLYHAAEGTIGTHGTDSDVKALFESIKVEHTGNRAILTATIPQGFIEKALAERPMDETSPANPPSPEPLLTPSPGARSAPKKP